METYLIKILPATNTKCLRASIYYVTTSFKPSHFVYVPMDYQFDNIIECAVAYIKDYVWQGHVTVSTRLLHNDVTLVIATFKDMD